MGIVLGWTSPDTCGDLCTNSLSGWRRKWQPTPVSLPRKSCGQRSLVGCCLWRWTWLKRLSMHACIGEGNGNPFQYSCLEKTRDRGAWWAAVYGVSQSRTRLERLSSRSSSSSLSGRWSLETPKGRGNVRRKGRRPILSFWGRLGLSSAVGLWRPWRTHLRWSHFGGLEQVFHVSSPICLEGVIGWRPPSQAGLPSDELTPAVRNWRAEG